MTKTNPFPSFTAIRDGKTLPKPKGRQFPRCWWNVKASGDRFTEEALGHRLALEYLDYEHASSAQGGPGHLPMIIADMPRALTGVEIGFLTLVSYAAAHGRDAARRVAEYWERQAA